jgi:hypothetical protein
LPFGAAFLRAVRFTFLRSALSSIFLVFATDKSSFRQSVCEMTREFHGNGIARRKKAARGTKEVARTPNEAPRLPRRWTGWKDAKSRWRHNNGFATTTAVPCRL